MITDRQVGNLEQIPRVRVIAGHVHNICRCFLPVLNSLHTSRCGWAPATIFPNFFSIYITLYPFTMHSHYDLENNQAGLDNTNLHGKLYNSNHPSAVGVAVGGVLYIAASGCADRPPLADKSHTLNISRNERPHQHPLERIGMKGLATSKVAACEQPVFLDHLYLNNFGDQPHATSSSFQALPPLPCTSSLGLSSFLGLSPQIVTTSRELTPALPNQLATERIHGAIKETRPGLYKAQSQNPTIMHPNSPYVPWASSLRREILSPSTPPPMSGCCSHICPRAGAQAPESISSFSPARALPRNGTRLQKISNGLRRMKSAVRKNIQYVAKHITRLKKSGQSVSVRRTEQLETRPLPPAGSSDSLNTISLNIWLAGRQRATVDCEGGFLHYASLDDYEQRGSWMDLSNVSFDRRLKTHLDGFIGGSRPTTSDEQQFTSWTPENRALLSSCSPTSNYSDPAMNEPNLTRPWTSTANRVSGGRMREQSMPGGWICNSPTLN